MKNMTAENIARAVGGRLVGSASGEEVSSVVIDSRAAAPGSLFVAIAGKRTDGHDHIKQAAESGAAAVMAERSEKAEEAGVPCILVDSTFTAIQRLAGYYLDQINVPVVGITGSAGKTGTKEMTAAVLAAKLKTGKTQGNLNSNLGLPLSIFALKGDEEAAVLEMGVSHFGEMTEMAKAARPKVMVITNIGECHLEAFRDRDGVLKEKGVALKYIREGGSAILCGEDDKLRTARAPEGAATKYYGFSPEFDVYADDIDDQGLSGSEFTLHMGGKSARMRITRPGRHSLLNALAAAAVGGEFGLSFEEIQSGLLSAETMSGRLNVIEAGGRKILDDCYNANPASVEAALRLLAGEKGVKCAVLGDMGELGENERALHRRVGRTAGTLGIDKFILVGELAAEIAEGIRDSSANAEISSFESVEDFLPKAGEEVPCGASVLVKASRFMHFERIVEALSGKE